jgi:hypothetical protein
LGGRGSSSGISDKGKAYGTEYSTLYQSGNIKFVKINNGSATPPMETMTEGRIYVNVSGNNNLKSITYYDKNNKRFKQIDLDHAHKINEKLEQPHKHKGYLHNEKGDYSVSPKEQKMVDRVIKTWYNKINK